MTQVQDEKETKKAALKARSEAQDAKEKAANAERKGKGTRVSIGMSRGKNPIEVTYEAFDESQPETLPKTLAEFMELSGIDKLSSAEGEALLVSYSIDGFNSAMYTAASDPVAEFVNPAWDADVQKQFRLVVRNYATGANVSIEDAVALIKPGIEASVAKAASKTE